DHPWGRFAIGRERLDQGVVMVLPARNDVNAVAGELNLVIGQNDMRFPLQCKKRLEKQDVGSTCRRREANESIMLLEPIADRDLHWSFELRGKASLVPARPIAHVSDENGDL